MKRENGHEFHESGELHESGVLCDGATGYPQAYDRILLLSKTS